ncbi:Hint domain-containing protein [Alkalilacustris brevis]|uniref:Hint domain-containing protein n=1 Tax=Alkalilacustris brevis TaxID=2026338 RepID=UPI000E0DA0D2|nr:Hint domain-containing protein [Alkalilacustris brevis]
MSETPAIPNHSSQVFDAGDIVVTSGANLGDGLDLIEEVCPGDIYQLLPDAAPLRLEMLHEDHACARGEKQADSRRMLVAKGSEIGVPGDRVVLRARLTLMAADGNRVELLALDHCPADRPHDVRTCLLPLSPMAPRTDYTLLAIDEKPRAVRLSDIVCVSLGRGTRISLHDGRQVAIENLSPGDRVLTRDHGAQPVRWVGRATLRAAGSFAPVVITAGAMGNAGDLIVSQHHRMFLYQRRRSDLLETSELLVQAKHLVDGSRIFLREGGYVDYFSLVFDRHEIIYAEGIPAESLLVNAATVAHLPEALAREVTARFPQLSQNQHFGTEAGQNLVQAIGREALLGAIRKD